uniref:Uncharacterized protein n=1 Tax=Avena sativa TaxID=4498 RepID=A0ACD5ZIM0_AVESA
MAWLWSTGPGIIAMFSVVAVVAALLMLPLGALAATTRGGKSSCTTICGGINIPYPFGVEPGCYHDGGFNLTCDHSCTPPKLFLGDGTVQVLDIDLQNATVRIDSKTTGVDTDKDGNITLHVGSQQGSGAGAGEGPYFVAEGRNNLVTIGCDVQVVLVGENGTLVSSCAPFCLDDEGVAMIDVPVCSGVLCCQAPILIGRASYGLQFHRLGNQSSSIIYPTSIVESDYSINMKYFYSNLTVPALLGWAISSSVCHTNGSSHSCRSKHSFCRNNTKPFEFGSTSIHGQNCGCSGGYQGNPYISHGCYDINECDYPDIYPCYGDCKNTPGGYDCQCPRGFKGNASKAKGCEDIDECKHPEAYPCYGICINMPGTFHCQCQDGTYGDPLIKQGCISVTARKTFTGLYIGLIVSGGSVILLLALAAPFLTRKIKLHRENKLKKRLFKQNHGLLLQQLISQKTDFGERMIIPLLDLQKATNNFDRTREAGGGGHGVVYKGILDLLVVAIKKSKIVVQREIDDFINEVAILSQINHRNVVKLIGCCLETEVPLLVYEFISNGTLDHHLHVEGPISLSWVERIRIVLEVSRALSYLHSAASMPIYHRDIKSSNILLDDNWTAKVADIGASRYIPIDQSGVTTAVQGTMGYLDPEYYYTGRLTDKSDVFSFGVLLVELLTRKKPFLYRSGGDGVGLVSHFVSLLAEDNLDEIIDHQVTEEGNGEVKEVATLAAMCIQLKGEDRPTMREVEMKLENLRINNINLATNIAARTYRGQAGTQYMPTEGAIVETSRQYTMEEEILLSASYPR